MIQLSASELLTSRREILGHTAQSESAVSASTSILLSVPFTLIGLAALAVASGIVAIEEELITALSYPLAMAGGFFLFGAAFMVRGGLRCMAITRRARKGLESDPQQPWNWDHRWNPEGVRTHHGREAILSLLAALIFGAFITPFIWWSFGPGHPSPAIDLSGLLARFAIGFVSVGWMIATAISTYLVVRWHRYGESSLRFSEFPFHLGRPLRVSLSGSEVLQQLSSLSACLRTVEEAYETRGSGKERKITVVCYATSENITEVAPSALAQAGDLSLEFPLPAEGKATRMSDRPPHYWELELNGKAPGADYHAIFLLPVY